MELDPIPTTNSIQRSSDIKELAAALSKFQGEVEAVKKDSENPFYKSKYAALDSIVETIRKPLSSNGLSYTQFPIGKNTLVTILMHTSGQYIMGSVEMNPKDSSPQAHGSAITYMRRYSLSSILGLATEDDDDGQAASTSKSTTTVKTGKAGSEEEYTKAYAAIEKYSTIAKLEEALDKVDKSSKFTDAQKNKLEKLISTRIDILSVQDEPN